MKFANIIREAGFNPESFPKCAELPIILYDKKKRISTSKTIHFVEPLFQHNDIALKRFHSYLSYLEKGLTDRSIVKTSMSIQISEDVVILDFQTPFCDIFFRYDHSR